MSFTILFSGFAALATLALAMPAHARSVFGREVTHQRRRLFRLAGWLMVAGLFVVEIRARGWALGVTYGIAALAVPGFVVTLALTYRPRVLLLLVTGALVVAGGLLVFAS